MGISLTDDQKLAMRRDMSIHYATAPTNSLDVLLLDLQAQIDALPVAGSVLEATLAANAVAPAKLKSDLRGLLLVADWGTPGVEAGNAIEVALQVRDVAGNAIAGQFVLEVQVSDTQYGGDSATATISDAAAPDGTILDGDDSAVVKVQTDATGKITLAVSEAAAASRYLHVRPCLGSPMIDCRDVATLTFA